MSAAGPVWVTGARGMLGSALVAELAARGHEVIATGREADVAERASLEAALAGRRPRCVFNAAAYTAVDAAEHDAERAFRVNAHGAGVVAELARDLGADLVHFSTDYVFDETTPVALREDAPIAPRGVYAKSKRGGEERVLATIAGDDRRVLIVRTSWLFGAHPRSFLTRILTLATERDELRVVADQHGRPTSADDLARVAIELASSPSPLAAAGGEGVLHFASPGGITTWHGFATAICAAARRQGMALRAQSIQPIATADLFNTAPRPLWSALDSTTVDRWLAARGIQIRSWSEAVEAYVATIAAHLSQARSTS